MQCYGQLVLISLLYCDIDRLIRFFLLRKKIPYYIAVWYIYCRLTDYVKEEQSFNYNESDLRMNKKPLLNKRFSGSNWIL